MRSNAISPHLPRRVELCRVVEALRESRATANARVPLHGHPTGRQLSFSYRTISQARVKEMVDRHGGAMSGSPRSG
jgi:hypothetical protein